MFHPLDKSSPRKPALLSLRSWWGQCLVWSVEGSGAGGVASSRMEQGAGPTDVNVGSLFSPLLHLESGLAGSRCAQTTWCCCTCHHLFRELWTHCQERMNIAQTQLCFLLVSVLPPKHLPFPLDAIMQNRVKGTSWQIQTVSEECFIWNPAWNIGNLVGRLIWSGC